MGELHELLAAEATLRTAAESVLGGVKALFLQAAGRLDGMVQTYHSEVVDSPEHQGKIVERATSVEEELGKFAREYGAWIDACVQKECTNAEAEADLSFDGVHFGSFSATALLNMESKLTEIISVYAAIPILDPAVRWTWDDEHSQWYGPVQEQAKTEKRQIPIVLYEATEEHPAQAQLVSRDVRIGRMETTNISARLARADVQDRMDRAKKLLVEVKKARARANKAEVVKRHVARNIFDYINGSKPQTE